MPPSAWCRYGAGPTRDGLPSGSDPHRGSAVRHRHRGPRLDVTTAGGGHPRGASPSRRVDSLVRGSPDRGPTPPAGLLVRPLGEPPWARRVSEMLRGLRLRQALGLVQSSAPTGRRPAQEPQHRASKCSRRLVVSAACSPAVSHRPASGSAAVTTAEAPEVQEMDESLWDECAYPPSPGLRLLGRRRLKVAPSSSEGLGPVGVVW